jgi:hypothetical protein
MSSPLTNTSVAVTGMCGVQSGATQFFSYYGTCLNLGETKESHLN